MNDYYVYVVFRLDGSPCYVGKGKNGRLLVHFRKKTNAHLWHIVQRAGGELPIVKVQEGLTSSEACITEIAFIKAIGREDLGTGPLVNFTAGGEGVSDLSPQARQKISSSARARKPTPEQRAKMSFAAKNRTKEIAEKIVASRIGRMKQTDETKQKKRIAQQIRRSKESVEQRKACTRNAQLANIGRKKGPPSPEHHEKLSRALKGKPWTDARRAAHCAKAR